MASKSSHRPSRSGLSVVVRIVSGCSKPRASYSALSDGGHENHRGLGRWGKTRATFHSYSAVICMLVATQCHLSRPAEGFTRRQHHQRGIIPDRIAGFRAWLKLGRSSAPAHSSKELHQRRDPH